MPYPIASLTVFLFFMNIKRISGEQHVPVCCNMWLRQVFGEEMNQRGTNKNPRTVSLKV